MLRAAVRQWRREWAAISVALVAVVALLSLTGGLSRIDNTVADAAMALHAPANSPDVVVIAVDDRSMAALGRWPWRRTLHAQLVKQLGIAGAAAVGLDVPLGEADDDHPDEDLRLAQTIAANGRVVLPVTLSGADGLPMPVLPQPMFIQAARALGHMHLQADSDGAVRAIHREEGGVGLARQDHLAVAVACTARPALAVCNARETEGVASSLHDAGHWRHGDELLISFAAQPTAITRLSYVDVVRGDVPAEALRGRVVLVGRTATGLAERFPTPMSRAEPMPGIEVVANATHGLLAGRAVVPARAWQNLVGCLLPLVVGLASLMFLGPLAGLLQTLVLMAATLGLALLSPSLFGVRLNLGAGLLGLLLSYPLWSWRRLSTAARYLALELLRLRADADALPPSAWHKLPSGDPLGQRILALEHATTQLRDLNRFVSESLRQLPQPMLVTDMQGHVLLGNDAAAEHFARPNAHALQSQTAGSLFEGAVLRSSGAPLLHDAMLITGTLPLRSEGIDAQGRTVLLQCAPFSSGSDEQRGWLLTIVNLTAIRRARQQRDEAMRFISHDIRAPNAAILTLLEVHRTYPAQMPMQEMLSRIERHARAGLDLAEGFVQLARAESHTYAREVLDLCGLLEEAVDTCWASARERGVTVTMHECPEAAPVLGDRNLLGRSLVNLLGNAIKFSPRGATVRCSIAERPNHWALSVQDRGPGIAPEKRARLFQAFERLHGQSHPQQHGIGLGLAFVRTVMVHHGGTVEIDSTEGSGSTFTLVLPRVHDHTPRHDDD